MKDVPVADLDDVVVPSMNGYGGGGGGGDRGGRRERNDQSNVSFQVSGLFLSEFAVLIFHLYCM